MVLEFGEYATLTHNRLDTALGKYTSLTHLLHGKHFHMFRSLILHLPHLAETALANALLVFKQVLAYS